MSKICTYEYKDGILHAEFPEIIYDDNFYSLPGEFAEIEKGFDIIPNRLVSLCKIKSFNVNFSSILFLAEKRNERSFANHFKTAILVCNTYQRGFARMYQTFIENKDMHIEIFADELKAIEWLKINEPD